MGKPKLYIFDCGGVVFDEHVWPELFAHFGVKLRNIREVGPKTAQAVEENMRGKITDAQLWETVSSEAGKKIDGSALMDRYYVTRINPGTVEIIEELKNAGERVVSGSNILPRTYEINCRRGNYDVFPKLYMSHLMGEGKPDPTFYTYILEREHVSPGEAFFTDDLERNIASAAALGIRTHLFRGAQGLRKSLVALGALPERK